MRSTTAPPEARAAQTRKNTAVWSGGTPLPADHRSFSLDPRRSAVDRNDERDDQDRHDVRDLDHRVDRRPGGVLVGIADGVAGDGGGVSLGALATVEAVLDQLLRVVPRAAARGHRDREEQAGDDRADEQAAEHLGTDDPDDDREED